MINMFDKEAMNVLLKLAASYSDLRSSMKDEDREEALRATIASALLSMRLLGFIPNLDKLGVEPVTTEEVTQLKKNLNSLLS